MFRAADKNLPILSHGTPLANHFVRWRRRRVLNRGIIGPLADQNWASGAPSGTDDVDSLGLHKDFEIEGVDNAGGGVVIEGIET